MKNDRSAKGVMILRKYLRINNTTILKGHTMKWLYDRNLFPLDAFVFVDPDSIRESLPELNQYNALDPKTAGFKTQKEVGYICELIAAVALEKGLNVLLDGSLRDSKWYLEYIQKLKAKYSTLRLAIIHVKATKETILERCRKRAEITGRLVPESLIIETLEQIPESLALLTPEVDYCCTFFNEDEPRLVWSSSTDTCATEQGEPSKEDAGVTQSDTISSLEGESNDNTGSCGGGGGSEKTPLKYPAVSPKYIPPRAATSESSYLSAWMIPFRSTWVQACPVQSASSLSSSSSLPPPPPPI